MSDTSNTMVDMPKITQMLDVGWVVSIKKNSMGSYTATAEHKSGTVWFNARCKILEQTNELLHDAVLLDWDNPGIVDTDDFTPEQALTRLAYKVQGEII